MITVFHLIAANNDDLRDRMYYEKDAEKKEAMCRLLWSRGHYDSVAQIDSDNLRDAFYLTNHIDEDWMESRDPRLTVMGSNHRSSSVCDVMVKDGVYYYVDRVGYVEMKLADHG
jgi:hypothetical protein